MFSVTECLLKNGSKNVLLPVNGNAIRRPCSRFCTLIVLFLATQLTGCKPAPPSSGNRGYNPSQQYSAEPEGAANGRPALEDVTGFLRAVSPPFVHVADVKMDTPVNVPNTSPTQRAWLCSLRFAYVPTEDLLGPARDTEAHAFLSVTDELAGWVHWQEAYTRSFYAHLYPAQEWRTPTPLVPAGQQPLLLSCLHPAGQQLPPIYAKLQAEWQVDRWRFQAVDLDLPEAGEPRASFRSPNVVLGSPEAAAFVQAGQAAITQAKEAKRTVDARYQMDLAKAARPGLVLKGQFAHRGNVVPAEVRLLPAANGDVQGVNLEMRLPATPGESFTYVAQLSKQVPLLPLTTQEADAYNPVPVLPELAAIPKGDLRLRLVTSNGKERPLNDMSLPNEWLFITRHYTQSPEVWLRLRDGQMEGRLGGYSTDATGFVLTAQQKD